MGLACVKCCYSCCLGVKFPSGKHDPESCGPAPDYSKRESWIAFGGADDNPAEMLPEGVERTPVEGRPADCFYIYGTTCTSIAPLLPFAADSCVLRASTARLSQTSVTNGTCLCKAPKQHLTQRCRPQLNLLRTALQ